MATSEEKLIEALRASLKETERLRELKAHAAAPAKSAAPATARGSDGEDLFVSLYRSALDADRADDASAMLAAAARLLPTFTDAHLVGTPKITRLAAGDTRPALACMIAPVAPMIDTSDSMLATGLPEPRDVSSYRPPGFVEGERIPANPETLFRAYGDAVLQDAGLDPVVLVGYSSGGWIAHGVAGCLTEMGRPPAAVALLDTYWPGTALGKEQSQHMRMQAERWVLMSEDNETAPLNYQLIVQGAYRSIIFGGWRPRPLKVPTLLVRAADYMSGESKPADVQASTGEIYHQVVTVPGNHYTMISRNSQSLGTAVHEWLEKAL
jgi:hypothetical protein